MRLKIKKNNFLISTIITLYTFQSALESISGVFSYIDEFVLVIAILLVIMFQGRFRRILSDRKVQLLVVLIFSFVFCGITSNIIFKYQTYSLVAMDLIANIKFFFSIVAGYFILKENRWEEQKKAMNTTASLASVVLFVTFVLDRIFNIWEGQVRFGIKSSLLFYPHPTYYAGALGFLIAILTATYDKKRKYFIVLDLIMLFFSLRSKAFVAVIVYIALFWHLIIQRKKLKLWHCVAIGILAFYFAWDQIYFYYFKLVGASARSVLTLTSFKIMKDYFPIGTGFGTYASHAAGLNYSPVYSLYGFENIWEVSHLNPSAFLDDTFWPIIIGQTGFLGTLSYIGILVSILYRCFKTKKVDLYLFTSSIFVMSYLFISSTAEPIFNNSISVPMGFFIGIVFRMSSNRKGKRI